MSLVDLGKRLLESAKHGETAEVRSLMTSGAPFTTDWLGISPLHMAAQYGHLSTAEVLLRGGISRDARTKVDRTPLHIAAQEGHYGIVELLLSQGAEVDARDMLKMTPLHWAADRSHPEVVKLLLQYKADINATSKFEKTPLSIAEDNEDKTIMSIIMKHLALPAAPVKQYNLSKFKPDENRLKLTNEVSCIAAIPVLVGPEIPDTSKSKTVTSPVFVAPPVSSVSSTGNLITDSVANNCKSPKASKPVFLHTSLETLQKAALGSSPSKKLHLNDSGIGKSLHETGSTSVLATLAALAEATAPNSSISTTEALQWLGMHGITMLPADNSTIVASAVEGGQTVSLTEAGKLALTWVKEHPHLNSDSMDVSSSVSDDTSEENVGSSETNSTTQKVITIVADQAHIPSIISSPQTPIVVLSSQQSIPIEGYEPVAKKMKIKSDVEVITNGNTVSSSEEDENVKLKKELERIRKEAELYKSQLLAKEFEAQNYKKQLEEMQTQPKSHN